MEFFNIICKDSKLELQCSDYAKSIGKDIISTGNDLIHFLVKDSRKENYFNFLKEYLDKYPDKVNIQNEKGFTPLMIASINSNNYSTLETVEYLLRKGADPNLRNKNGDTALLLASRFSNTDSSFETVEYLLTVRCCRS